MNQQQTKSPKVAVIGGGISGLAAANRLVELNPDGRVVLFESRDRLGGALWTKYEEGFQVEQGVDNFITTVPWGMDLCKRLGLEDELVQTDPKYRRTFVVRGGKLYKLPDGFLMMAPARMWPLAVTPILSPLGKMRCALEYFLPPRAGDEDESMSSFVCRRLGRQAFDRLVEPLVGAVYAADLEKLSVEATLPRFREMERKHGSLIRAMRSQMAQQRKKKKGAAAESGARFSMFVTLRRGMSSMVEAIAERITPEGIRLSTAVKQLTRDGDGWLLDIEGGQPERFDSVVLAAPSHAAAELLKPHDEELSADLATITHSGTAIASFGFDREQIGHPLDGMGIVVPAIENSPILACSLSSRKYPHRAPEGKVLLRVFVGGSRWPELATMEESELTPWILGELSKLLQIEGSPTYTSIARWPRSMPQYHVGHKDLVSRIEKRMESIAGIELAGNAYRGVGIPDCINYAQQAVERVLGRSDAQGAWRRTMQQS